jgi:hypothetical protein
MKISVELSEEELRDMIAKVESQIGDLRSKIKAASSRRDELQAALSGAYAPQETHSPDLLDVLASQAQISPTGRVRRGDSENLVLEYLRSGEVKTTREIADAVPVAYSTVCRVLGNHLEAGRVEKVQSGQWRIKA